MKFLKLDRKAIYEQKVQETVIKLADLMIDNSVNGILTMRAAELRHALNVTAHAFNEASGRLQATGFHSGVKRFKVQELKERRDQCLYYYQINAEKHPHMLNPDDIETALKKRRKVLERKKSLWFF
ncbi:hypothetical protein BRE01_14350 [Brevibacillus reuszeri]|uniref:Uncharacterized protein n=1 Tax=Brevibacillus reuszeri TaxID=54915 RepID=A0A0K9Z2D3_9BACL|nr:hypothetical protein [Brevibacillus reuszeri]KNB74625.1 hypothetical protein ADS79_02780 [Brevibacillus reuszeri]MED1856568.1 hypothetical protein [Brevibacillus reuszeri]GED67733.1 hypothetical protein BRE01_14350 [Brevibacillus reuszeri]